MYRRVGSDGFNSISQPMVSRYITKYSDIITNELAPIYVRFPQNNAEIAAKKLEFEQNYHFPGIVGVVDGTHIYLSAVLNRIEHAFVNRKQRHSINAQIVCDAKMIITNVNARYPGATHDAYIFGGSMINTFLQNNNNLHPNDWTFLLGNLYH